MASPPLMTHPIVSAASPDMRKRWECRCFAPFSLTTVLTTTMTTVGLPDTSTDTARELALCLLAQSPCAYGSRVRFHPLRSATPLVLRALNPRDGSNSSSLTSTNVSLLTSLPPEKRKVAGSILALATKIWAVQWLFRLSLRLWIPDSDLAMGPIWGQRIVVAVGASAQVS